MVGLQKQLRDIQQQIDDLYYRPVSLGTQKLNSHLIKTKTLTANDIDVSDLESITQNTGNLVVTGGITAGSGLNAMGWTPSNGIFLGNSNPALAPFSVTPQGQLGATGADVSGVITATTLAANQNGSIAGWNIDSSKLSRDNVGIGANGIYRFWSGLLSSPALSNFNVDTSGNIKAASGVIAGWTADSAKFTNDSGNTGLGVSGSSRIWAGGSPASAPFRVDSVGNMVSTSANISGVVNASSGSFTGTVTTGNLHATGGTLGGLTINGTLTVSGGAINVSSGNINVTGGNVAISSGGRLTWNSGLNYIDSSEIFFNLSGSNATYLNWDNLCILQAQGGTQPQIAMMASNQAGEFGIVTAHTATGVGQVSLQGTSGSDTNFLTVSNSNVVVQLRDSAGSAQFRITSSTGAIMFGTGSDGSWIRQKANDSTALGAYYGRIPIFINGALKYLGVYN